MSSDSPFTDRDYQILSYLFRSHRSKIDTYKSRHTLLTLSILNIDYTELDDVYKDNSSSLKIETSVLDKYEQFITYKEEKDTIIISFCVVTDRFKFSSRDNDGPQSINYQDTNELIAQAYNSTRSLQDLLIYLHNAKCCHIDKLIYAILYAKKVLFSSLSFSPKSYRLLSLTDILATLKYKPVAFISVSWSIIQTHNYYEQLLCPHPQEYDQCEPTNDLYYTPLIYTVIYHHKNRYYIFRNTKSYIYLSQHLASSLNETQITTEIQTELQLYIALPLVVFTTLDDALPYINSVYGTKTIT